MPYDFQSLNATLLQDPLRLLNTWLPGGKLRGQEYICAGIQGGKGESMAVNTQTGAWLDGAVAEHRGRDLVSLYATIRGASQGEAYRELSGDAPQQMTQLAAPVPPPPAGIKPPPDQQDWTPRGCKKFWTYRDASGDVLFHIARYNNGDGKYFKPWAWSGVAWVAKGWPSPRPLYGLDKLAEGAVLVVEGEKAADAARKMCKGGPYSVVTWANGAAGVGTADWSPLAGRNVLVWPDADGPGAEACARLVKLLTDMECSVKTVDTAELADGFDAADLECKDWSELKEWLKPRVRVPGVQVLAPTVIQENTVTVVEDAPAVKSSAAQIALTYGLEVRGNSGAPVTNVDNAYRVLSRVPGFHNLMWWDEFYSKILWVPEGAESPVEWTEKDTLAMLVRFQRELGFHSLSVETMHHAITMAAYENVRNEPRDWMRGLKWDGVKRVESFIHQAFGATDNLYTRAVSQNWFVSMAARIFRPGCKMDTMVILEGAQGAGKSRALDILGGRWFGEATESVTSKDFYLCLQGKLIVEIAEMDSFHRGEVTRIKQVMSSRVDRYRVPYGRQAQDFPRQGVFVGTTNESHYLRDNTGARRFWPVEVLRIDLDYIAENREQLFAEAVALFEAGNAWWLMPEGASAQQELRRQHDDWENIISEYCSLHESDGVTTSDVWVDALGGVISRFERHVQLRIASVLKTIHWKCCVVKDASNKSVRRWYPETPF